MVLGDVNLGGFCGFSRVFMADNRIYHRTARDMEKQEMRPANCSILCPMLPESNVLPKDNEYSYGKCPNKWV